MWIAFLIVAGLFTACFFIFIIRFWSKINEEILQLEKRLERYNTIVVLFAGFLITFLALTFNNKPSYEMELQKIEIRNNQQITPEQQQELIYAINLASNDRAFVGNLASLDLSLYILLLLCGTFLPGEILKTRRNRKIYIITFITSFYILLMVIASVSDNLLR